MQLFYDQSIKDDVAVGSVLALPEEESRHAFKVLRLRAHDLLHVTNGCGLRLRGRIEESSAKAIYYRVEEIIKDKRRSYSLHMALAPTKNIKRFEWFLEKATEVGIEEITPFFSFHSERRSLKIERLNSVITAAVKQSLKTYHPVLHPPLSFKEMLQQDFAGQKFIAHYEGPEQKTLAKALKAGSDVLLFIGPEGDFSSEELEAAQQAGFESVSLGNTRLRTETAALAGVFIFNIINDL